MLYNAPTRISAIKTWQVCSSSASTSTEYPTPFLGHRKTFMRSDLTSTLRSPCLANVILAPIGHLLKSFVATALFRTRPLAWPTAFERRPRHHPGRSQTLDHVERFSARLLAHSSAYSVASLLNKTEDGPVGRQLSGSSCFRPARNPPSSFAASVALL